MAILLRRILNLSTETGVILKNPVRLSLIRYLSAGLPGMNLAAAALRMRLSRNRMSLLTDREGRGRHLLSGGQKESECG